MKASCAQIASGPFLQPRGGFTTRLVRQQQLQAFQTPALFQGLAMCLHAQGFCEMCKCVCVCVRGLPKSMSFI